MSVAHVTFTTTAPSVLRATLSRTRLTGLSRRQVQYWSDRCLLPHGTDERGFRSFEAPAAIVAFALRDAKQHERQFYADLAVHERPLLAVCGAARMVGIRMLDLAQDADPQDSADAEKTFRAIAESIRTVRVHDRRRTSNTGMAARLLDERAREPR